MAKGTGAKGEKAGLGRRDRERGTGEAQGFQIPIPCSFSDPSTLARLSFRPLPLCRIIFAGVKISLPDHPRPIRTPPRSPRDQKEGARGTKDKDNKDERGQERQDAHCLKLRQRLARCDSSVKSSSNSHLCVLPQVFVMSTIKKGTDLATGTPLNIQYAL